MTNTYAAHFGDVVKHAVLCEVVVHDRPPRYLESHGGTLVYDLTVIEPVRAAYGTSSRRRRSTTT